MIADAGADGLVSRSGAKTEGDAQTAEEPLAEWERELLGADDAAPAVAAPVEAEAAPLEEPVAEVAEAEVPAES